MEGQREGPPRNNRGNWTTRKKDLAPRGVYRHPSGDWAIRYTCGVGHLHKERVGRIKNDAKDARDARRARARREPGWCPTVEKERERERSQREEAQEKARISFQTYANDYIEWAKRHKRAWTTDRSCLNRIQPVFANRKLDEIT